MACTINEIFTLNSCENLCDLKKKKTFLQILFLDLNSLFIKSDLSFSKTTTFNFEFSYAEICAFLYDKSVFSELIMCILDNKVCFKNNSRRISDGNI